MGQNTSVPSGSHLGRRRSFRNSWRSPFPRRSHTHKSSLSAAVNFIDVDPKHIELLNVNTASEEELMTLPGITRHIARSIVEYRQAIGRFKKVEDLALVSGVGAEKLDLIRPEICVRSKNASCASSRAQSFDSIASSEFSQAGSTSRTVDVNSATVFELMTVNGLNQELAANIVEHRLRRGPFRTLEDLAKVKGISHLRLGAIRSQITMNLPENLPVRNGYVPHMIQENSTSSLEGHKRKPQTSLKYGTSNGFLAIGDIFEMLSASTPRPIVEEDFQYERNGKPAIRIASWNLQCLTVEKIENPGVKEIFCRTILENKFSVIAVQEVMDSFTLKKICEELNSPTLRKVAEWKDNSKNWKCCTCEKTVENFKGSAGLGFIYDCRNDLQILQVKEVELSEACPKLARSIGVLLMKFKVTDTVVSLLNMYVKDSNEDSFSSIEQMTHDNFQEDELLIILGDFTGLKKNKEMDDSLKVHYRTIIPTTISTNANENPVVKYADNILLNKNAQSLFTGVWGIVRQGLSHLAIPKGWLWGGCATEHCPVWCELFTGTTVQHS
ncbi:endonuclease/exonuclease/phosphatase family domain-containing protein 1-like [Schistocerca gregaria]|uniref:endonuclease/exonuclease/phosphatase family domain-containing protein 1-like n=1 Tax=Schistocerca gregaria TaxID=7010 RepID=UPI00211E9D09|nr:endonuclease/exonuclease/phosphatase family domain-containing protein 1-like [Schistocerca gregaria]XP_049857190.1 endonuclease/exonuclease/phosphatase family domain-containing protein 1-like [Schistocerca gregaria]XP_049857191.1 endonuclease/exonuclease/phosphatase family domain-containing protein 1-like [Schistocerca gregaria]